MDIEKIKQENQNVRELVNTLEKNREKIALGISELYDYYSFVSGFDYVLDELKSILLCDFSMIGLEAKSMIYYEDYRLRVVEIDGKYTIYDAKYGGRAIHKDVTKEWTDIFIQRVLSKRKTR